MKRPIRASPAFKKLKPAEKFTFGTNVITALNAAATEFPGSGPATTAVQVVTQ